MEPIRDCGDALPLAPVQTSDERRCEPDRRGEPTRLWDAFSLTGRRQGNRRADERRRPHFVDRFSSATFVLVLLLLTASIVDAVLTIHLLREGADELNPLMDHLLARGIQPFLLVKYVLTAGGLPLLVIYQNHYLFGTRVRVGHLIPIAVAMYAILIGYQFALIHSSALAWH
jgi:hypothetical protein